LRSPLPRAAVETFLEVFSTPALTWADLAKAREWTSLPILLKGIVHPDDAARAIDEGVDGVWVSNHGGRQIDASVPTLDVLPEIVERVAGRAPIVFDSGVRTGSDALIALALGADVVAIGRPYAYGLEIAGEEGVAEVIRNILAELDITLGLAGRTCVRGVDRGVLREVWPGSVRDHTPPQRLRRPQPRAPVRYPAHESARAELRRRSGYRAQNRAGRRGGTG